METRRTARTLAGGFEVLPEDSLKCHVRGGWVEKDGIPINIASANLILPDDEPDIYIYVNMTSNEIQFNTSGWVKDCKRLCTLATAGGVISASDDCSAVIRFSHHSAYATHDSWLKEATINADQGWTDFDVSAVVAIPPWAKGILLEIHVKETGAIAGDDSYIILRKPGDAAQSQWKLIAPQISGRFFTRTVAVEFGDDGKTIQYRADVETSLVMKVGLAGWVPGRI